MLRELADKHHTGRGLFFVNNLVRVLLWTRLGVCLGNRLIASLEHAHEGRIYGNGRQLYL